MSSSLDQKFLIFPRQSNSLGTKASPSQRMKNVNTSKSSQSNELPSKVSKQEISDQLNTLIINEMIEGEPV